MKSKFILILLLLTTLSSFTYAINLDYTTADFSTNFTGTNNNFGNFYDDDDSTFAQGIGENQGGSITYTFTGDWNINAVACLNCGDGSGNTYPYDIDVLVNETLVHTFSFDGINVLTENQTISVAVGNTIDFIFTWSSARQFYIGEIAVYGESFEPLVNLSINQSTYNMTSDGGCTVWRTNTSTNCNTTDETSTFTFETNKDANCSVRATQINTSNFTSYNSSFTCGTTGGTTHICTVYNLDILSVGQNYLYGSCSDNIDNTTTGPLSIFLINNIPNIVLNYPPNNSIFEVFTITFNYTVTDDDDDIMNVSFYLDNELNFTNTSVANGTTLVNNITFSGTSHSWYINATDGKEYNVSETRYFSVNSLPVTQSSTIFPTIPDTSNDMLGYCNISDGDNEPINITFVWYKNNIINNSGTYVSLLPGNYNVNNISSSNLFHYDNWTLQCEGTDGKENSTPLNSSVVTINTIPGFSIDGVYGETNGIRKYYDSKDIVGYCNATDEDVTNLNLNYTWYINNVKNESGAYIGNPVTIGELTNIDNLSSDNFEVGYQIVLECTAWYNPSNSSNSTIMTVESATYPINITLDGVDSDRTYEYQTYVNITAIPNLNVSSTFCLNIGYPGYGDNYICDNKTIQVLLHLSDSTIDTFYTGVTSEDYEFKYYGWLSNNIIIDNSFNITNASMSLSGSQSELTLNQLDDWGTDLQETYDISSASYQMVYLTVDADTTFLGTKFTLTSTDNVTNISIDVLNDGIIDYNYIGTLTELSNTIANFDISVINGAISGTTTTTIPFNITVDESGNLTIFDVAFVKQTATYPTNIQIDLGYDGAIDAQYQGTLIGSTLSVTEDSNGNSSITITCTTDTCQEDLIFELNKVQIYDSCYIYLQGSGYDDSFSEDFSTTTNINSSTLEQNTFFGQVEMVDSGGFQDGQLISNLIAESSADISEITLTADGQTDTGSQITYYISVDNGTNWYEVSSGIERSIPVSGQGTLVKYKIVMNSNPTQTANAYVSSVVITGMGDYIDSTTIIVNSTEYIYDYVFDNSLGLFKANFGCSAINSFLSECVDLICDLPVSINVSGPGIILANQYFFSGSLDEIVFDTDVFDKHLTNSKTTLTSVLNDTSEVNNTIFNLTMDYPTVSISNDVFINVTGNYWR